MKNQKNVNRKNFSQRKMAAKSTPVQLKVCLINLHGSQMCARRLAVDHDITFYDFINVLQRVLPLTQIGYRLTWKDEEGDFIQIETDEELKAALLQDESPVHLRVEIRYVCEPPFCTIL
ncbi:hypothetical protein B566_EDAN017990 [Ephemera danica]|nr:hypothetical protein B566_EDAN017990 [Ephemera danica]